MGGMRLLSTFKRFGQLLTTPEAFTKDPIEDLQKWAAHVHHVLDNHPADAALKQDVFVDAFLRATYRGLWTWKQPSNTPINPDHVLPVMGALGRGTLHEKSGKLICQTIPLRWYTEIATRCDPATRSNLLVHMYRIHTLTGLYEHHIDKTPKKDYLAWCAVWDETLRTVDNPSQMLMTSRMQLWLWQYGQKKLALPIWHEWKAPAKDICAAGIHRDLDIVVGSTANCYPDMGGWLWAIATQLPSPLKYELTQIVMAKKIPKPFASHGFFDSTLIATMHQLEARMLAWDAPSKYRPTLGEYCQKAEALHAWREHQKDTDTPLSEHEKMAALLFDDGAAFWAYVDNPVALASKPVVETMPDGAFEL